MSHQSPKDLYDAAHDVSRAVYSHNEALAEVERYDKYAKDAHDRLDAATKQLKVKVAAFDTVREWLAHSGPKTMRSSL